MLAPVTSQLFSVVDVEVLGGRTGLQRSLSLGVHMGGCAPSGYYTLEARQWQVATQGCANRLKWGALMLLKSLRNSIYQKELRLLCFCDLWKVGKGHSWLGELLI